MKRLIFLTLLLLLLSPAALVTKGKAYSCYDSCMDDAIEFIIQCYNATGDASNCTQAGHMIYCACRGLCDPQNPTPECQ